tara:strand:- start:196 stop:462 length:267 start_codon:yes stop_codon:yes gene_type:complete
MTNNDLPILIHSRDWLENVVHEAIEYNDWHIKKISSLTSVASAKAMTLSDLRQRRAMLLWVLGDLLNQVDLVPENIQINAIGQDVTPE